ncbi:MAG: glycosyl hydrolase [Candidatus Aminicenantes bacterium RBG_19FT_COMBO_58_17]|nr:MAG: glycosyl hydrolase [Candidatus Aminicenantes bacterium RBG_19FT_COMBO_58_17]
MVFSVSGWGAPAQRERRPAALDSSLYKAMEWRSIGPFRGGRATAVAGVPSQPYTYYFGATGGGVWKTDDGGLNWKCVSDGFFRMGSVGAIAVSEYDPNVVYVGMGEAPIRGNVSHGDGMYRSTDAGKTWKNVGLAETSQISRVRIHPRNPDLAYVAALGHVFGPNEERGIFRTSDGGKTWERILFRNTRTGAIDLALDPSNPRNIYAALWEAGRTPHSLTSGGPGSGLFKSTDGGATWTEISRHKGLPQGVLGKIGVTVSPAVPDRVWAIVEAADGGVFRSDDGGLSWQRVNDDRRLRQRAWYYSRIYADPKDAETVYVLNTGFYRSTDGGKTYSAIRVPHGDNHDLWVDPGNPQRMINSNDGGANVTTNGGLSWTAQDNQPTAQFYHLAVDNRFPYWVYGAQQDNSTVRIASRTDGSGIGAPDWHGVGGGESGFVVPRPDNPDIVYAGSYSGLITRWDYRTRQERVITAWPEEPMGAGAAGLKYRYQWTAPIVVSRHDPNVLYHAAQVLFKTTNEGQSWEVISPDLTTNDKDRQQSSGGPITQDNTGVEYYCTIFALAESFQDPNILWAGTDDGLVQLTRDGGKTWENITPRELPKWSLISMIEPSTFDPAVAFLAVDRHELDDFKPYIYKTEDFGRTWRPIVTGLPKNTFVRVVREDPKRKGLLYSGTETGAFVSFNDGATWQSLQLNLPAAPIHDLVVKEDDLVVATHGRSFWILDDLTPLHQLDEKVAAVSTFLFKPRDAFRTGGGSFPIPNVGKNPPSGTVVFYYFKEKPKQEVVLEIMDSNGSRIKTFSSLAKTEAEPEDEFSRMSGGEAGRRLPAEAGMNRFIWDMRYPDAERVPGAVLWGGSVAGPIAVPGIYQVKLTIGEESHIREWEWKKDPRIETSTQELREQFDFLIEVRNKLSEINRAVNQLRRVRAKIDQVSNEIKGRPEAAAVLEEAKKVKAQLTAVEEILIQAKSKSSQDPLNYPVKLDDKIAALATLTAGADARPTDQSRELFRELADRADAEIVNLKAILESGVPNLNTLLKDAGIPHIIIE